MKEARWRDDEDMQKRRKQSWDEAVRDVNLCAQFYRHQSKNGFHFLHEHPHSARSWGLASMQRRCDICMFGMTSRDDAGRAMSVRKPTRFLMIAWGIADELDRRCDGEHRHQALLAGRARDAAIYPRHHSCARRIAEGSSSRSAWRT